MCAFGGRQPQGFVVGRDKLGRWMQCLFLFDHGGTSCRRLEGGSEAETPGPGLQAGLPCGACVSEVCTAAGVSRVAGVADTVLAL